ncbi:MAG: hypothetical protein LBV45_10585 [Xanthomonadaceae bacterium]|nr:hypothetical protein [Xanthomonadaceae bacterium]
MESEDMGAAVITVWQGNVSLLHASRPTRQPHHAGIFPFSTADFASDSVHEAALADKAESGGLSNSSAILIKHHFVIPQQEPRFE